MTTDDTTTTMTGPGIYSGIPPETYHAHPALSASGAKLLVPPHVPADFDHARRHGRKDRASFDFGHLAHREVLGVGDEYEVVYKVTRDKQRVPADTMDTKSAQAHAAEIRAEGKVPVLADWLGVVRDMAAAIRAHPEAHALLTSGEPEVSALWTDPATGVDMRCRFDVLPPVVDGRRLIIPDYKTARDPAPALFNKRIGDYGYHLQAANYTNAARLLLGAHDPAFVFVVQRNVEPYHVAVVEPDEAWLRIGREAMDYAARTYARCTAADEWPAYPGIHPVSPPPWVEIAHEDLMNDDDEDVA